MAKKKSRVPTPPRRADAPRPRPNPQRKQPATSAGGGVGRSRLAFIGLAAAIVVVGIVIAVVTLVGGGEDASAALAAAGCTDQSYPAQGREHVVEPKEDFAYNSFPPTSGPHHPQYAIWNQYDRPVQQLRLIHNLEHGGIVVQYGKDVPQTTIDQVEAWYQSDPTAIVVAPLAGNALPDKIALTAWTQLAVCPGFDEKAFDAFRDANIFNGPERFPENRLEPGM